MLIENKIISKPKFVKKTGPSLTGILYNSQRIALRNKFGYNVPCNRGNGSRIVNDHNIKDKSDVDRHNKFTIIEN